MGQRLMVVLLLSCCMVHARAQTDPAPAQDRAALRDHVVRVAAVRPGPAGEAYEEGGGFLIAAGQIVTCLHVIAGATRASVILADNRAYPITGVSAIDAWWDLALLRCDLQDGEVQPLALAAAPPAAGAAVLLPVLEHLYDERETIEGEPRTLLLREGHALAPVAFSRGNLVRAELSAKHGDSGSPLLDADSGRVCGVVAMIDEYEYASRVVTYAIPASVVGGLLAASDAEVPVAASLGEWQRLCLKQPMAAIEGALALHHAGKSEVALWLIDLCLKGAAKNGTVVPREAYWMEALLLGDAADDAYGEAALALRRRGLAAARRGIDAPTTRVIDELLEAGCFALAGVAHRELAEPLQAHGCLKRAIELQGDHLDAIILLGRVAIDLGDEAMFRRQVRRLRAVLGDEAAEVSDLRQAWRDAD